MATPVPVKKAATEKVEMNHIRITLTSLNVRNLEKTSAELVDRAKQHNLKVSGPVRLPTKRLRVTCRKTPCGEGSKTWDRYQMRIHKRIIDLEATPDVVRQIARITIEPGVDVEVTVSKNVKKRQPAQKGDAKPAEKTPKA